MAKILYGTTYISEDEPCLGLYEMHLQSPDSRGFHRYQIILVIRDDKPAEFRKDLGLAKKWENVDQFRIPGGIVDGTTGKIYIEHTVGELRDIARKLRESPTYQKSDLPELNRWRYRKKQKNPVMFA